MNVYIYDVPSEYIKTGDGKNIKIDANKKYAYCKGCFGCWLQKPGKCVMADSLECVGSTVMQANTLTIISECCYGGYSPKLKKIIDRCIPGVMPFFVTKRNLEGKREQHHIARYPNRMKLVVWFYGAKSDAEKETARQLVNANAINYWADECEIHFVNSAQAVLI